MGETMDQRNDIGLIAKGMRNRLIRATRVYVKLMLVPPACGFGWEQDERDNYAMHLVKVEVLNKMHNLHAATGDQFWLN